MHTSIFILSRWLLAFAHLCMACTAFAHSGVTHPSTDEDRTVEALHWIELQQLATGEFLSDREVATGYQATEEALAALALYGYVGGNKESALEHMAHVAPTLNTEHLARLIAVSARSGRSVGELIAQLLGRQNSDGGFGHVEGFSSTPLDTAYALSALTVAKMTDVSGVTRAVSYLVANQAADGGYSLGYPSSPSSVFITSAVTNSLRHYLFSQNVAPTLNNAIGYLYAQQSSDGGWGSQWETSLALQALIPVTTDTSRYMTATVRLKEAQGSDGEWEGSVYSTALALSALRMLSTVKVPADPSKATVTGVLIDSEKGTAIAGASVTVASNPSAITEVDATGKFSVLNLEPGSYQFIYSAPGYLTASHSLSLSIGQLANVGKIGLAMAPTTALISGQLSDAKSSGPVAGANISVTVAGASFAAVSDAVGNYQLAVAPGAATVTVSSAQHHAVTVHANLMAGTHTQFSPSLYLLTDTQPQGTSLAGRVVDAESAVGIAGVVVTIESGNVTTTDAAGDFELVGVSAGTQTLRLEKAGYQSLALSTVVPENAVANLGVISMPELVDQPASTVSGRVTSLSSGQGIAGASVTVGPHSTQTDDNGFYQLAGITVLEFEVGVSAAGYVFSKKLITLAEHASVQADIVLRRADIGGVSIAEVSTDKPAYTSFESVLISAAIKNDTAVEQRVRLYVQVADEGGQLLDSFPANHLPPLGAQASEEEIRHFEGHLAESIEVLAPHESRLVSLERWWNVERIAPGNYTVTVQAVDAATSQLMSELGYVVTVLPTEDIASLSLAASPEFALLGSQAEVTLTGSLFNRSNVAVSSELQYRLVSPSKAVLFEGTTTINLEPETVNQQLELGHLAQHFTESGKYRLEVQVLAGVVPSVIRPGEVFVPPTTRLDIQQSLQPSEVVPLEGVKTKIQIDVKGVDGE